MRDAVSCLGFCKWTMKVSIICIFSLPTMKMAACCYKCSLHVYKFWSFNKCLCELLLGKFLQSACSVCCCSWGMARSKWIHIDPQCIYASIWHISCKYHLAPCIIVKCSMLLTLEHTFEFIKTVKKKKKNSQQCRNLGACKLWVLWRMCEAYRICSFYGVFFILKHFFLLFRENFEFFFI
jgi:hypothetical protein